MKSEQLNLQKFKNKKTTKKAADILKWFPAKAYNNLPWRDAAFWYEQLSIRREILLFQASPKKFSGDTKKLILQCIETLKTKPILNLSEAELLRLGGQPLLYARKKINALGFGKAIKEMTVKDVELLAKKINRNKKLKFIGSSYIDPVTALVSLHERFQIPAYINLNLPDDLLIADFERFLNEQRKNDLLANKNKARQTVLGNWNANAILPYLDIVIWGTSTKSYVSWPAIAEILFGDKTKAETVRKITYETVAYALSDISLERLFYEGVSRGSKRRGITSAKK